MVDNDEAQAKLTRLKKLDYFKAKDNSTGEVSRFSEEWYALNKPPHNTD